MLMHKKKMTQLGGWSIAKGTMLGGKGGGWVPHGPPQGREKRMTASVLY
jgi:hypothetical protein